MNYYNASGQMDLSDRIAIETGICIGESFKKIAKRLRRHPSTIAHEVKENRTFIKGNYPNGKDCRMARQCTVSMDFTQWSIDSVGHMRILSMR